MVKTTTVTLRLTPEQRKILADRTRSAGFFRKSEYVRYILFLTKTSEEKIDKIYKKVCKDD